MQIEKLNSRIIINTSEQEAKEIRDLVGLAKCYLLRDRELSEELRTSMIATAERLEVLL